MGFVRKTTGLDLTGGGARNAAEQSAREQENFQREGLAALRGDLAPYRDQGAQAMNQLMALLNQTPQQQADELLANPMYRQLVRSSEEDILKQRAALGLAGSGGTSDMLQRNLLELAPQFQQNRYTQLFNTAGMGQNAAAMTGTNTMQGLTNIGGIRSAPLAVGAQVSANQGQQFMSALPGLMSGLGFSGPAAGSQGLGGMVGAGLGGLGGMLGGLFSDRRLKRDIVKVGEDANGNIYHFKYIWSEQVYEGRMADELAQIKPDAVEVTKDGYLRVAPEFMAITVDERVA